MARLGHGDGLDSVSEAQDASARRGGRRGIAGQSFRASAAEFIEARAAAGERSFDFAFPELRKAQHQLEPGAGTLGALEALAASMRDVDASGRPDETPEGDSAIPAVYTYLGQFIDHDITLDPEGVDVLEAKGLVPLSSLPPGLQNGRSAQLELDSLYDPPAPVDRNDPRRMSLGRVSYRQLDGQPVPGILPVHVVDDFHDLRRKPLDKSSSQTDREALIGDARNDENLVIAQLHVAFLRAHNALAAVAPDFATARRAMRQRYQWLVLNDFLRRICDPGVLQDVLANGPRHFRIEPTRPLFIPLEFSAAAYRFGHSMIRGSYDFNANFGHGGRLIPGPADFSFLFTFTALSGQLGSRQTGESPTLPFNWIIDWSRFFPLRGSSAVQRARKINTLLTEPMFHLRKVDGSEHTGLAAMLARRNLLRGYRFGLPTGQAVAAHFGEQALSGKALQAVLPQAQKKAVEPFASRTPLWFYLLAEAGAPRDKGGADGEHLGRVGSRIVAETFWNLVRRSEDSILAPGAKLGFQRFGLRDLFELAGVAG